MNPIMNFVETITKPITSILGLSAPKATAQAPQQNFAPFVPQQIAQQTPTTSPSFYAPQVASAGDSGARASILSSTFGSGGARGLKEAPARGVKRLLGE